MVTVTPIEDLLEAWSAGDLAARDAVFEQSYSELRSIARHYLRREDGGDVLDEPDALVNEAYLRLADSTEVSFDTVYGFFGFVSMLMRRVLIDYARKRNANKRGGTRLVPLGGVDVGMATGPETLETQLALSKLEKLDPYLAEVVRIRFLEGYTVKEAADELRVSTSSLVRQWRTAKLLLRELV